MQEDEESDTYDELEDVEAAEAEEMENVLEPDTELLGYPCVKTLLRSYGMNGLPCVFMDRNLNLIWKNPRYDTLFSNTAQNGGFMKLFRWSMDDDAVHGFVRQIRDSESGFSWRGKISHRISANSTVIANVSLTPIFPLLDIAQDAEPLGYLGIFDDVTQETRELLRNTYKSLLEASKLKDNDTGNHIERVNSYSRRLAAEMEPSKDFREVVDREFIEDIGFLAAMHDVGKIGTPDDILNKNGPLEPWQWEIMKEHTVNGAYLLSTHPKLMAKDIALFHHERWDGKGYPYGLSEGMTPLPARIVAIADVYDALRSKRSYKKALCHEETCSIIEKDAGTHFDPVLVEIFSGIKEDFMSIYARMADEETEAESR